MNDFFGELDSRTYLTTLKNGLCVVLREDKNVPIVSVHMRVKAGSSTEYDKLGHGLSHFFEHSVFLGSSKNREPNSFFSVLESYGATNINAYTSFDNTTYYYTVLSKNLKASLYDLEDLLFHPLFPEKEVKNEMGSILSEIQMTEDDVDQYYYNHFYNVAFDDLPYQYPVIGFKEKFSALTANDLMKYYHQKYSVNNMILTLVGDFDIQNMLSHVEEVFSKKIPQKLEKYVYIRKEERKSKIREMVHPNAHSPRLSIFFDGLPFGHSDMYPLDVLADILGGGYSSLLYRRLKEELDVVQDVDVSSSNLEFGGVFSINFSLKEGGRKEIEKSIGILDREIKTILEDVREGKIEERYFEMIKNNLIDSYITQQLRFSSQASGLASSVFYTGDIHYGRNYIEKIKEMKSSDVSRVVQHYLLGALENRFLLYGKEIKGDEPILENARFKEGYEENPIDMFAVNEEMEETAGGVKGEERQMPGGFTRYSRDEEYVFDRLSNGLQIIYRKSTRIPKVHVGILSRGGAIWENEAPGGFNLLSTLMSSSNEFYPHREFVSRVETKAIGIYPHSGYSFFGVTLSCLEDKMEHMGEVFSHVVFGKTFHEKDFDMEKKNILYEILRKQREEGWSICNKEFSRLFFAGTPFAKTISGEEEEVKKLDRRSVETLKKDYLTPANSLCILSGSLSYDDIWKRVAFLEKWDVDGQRVEMPTISSNSPSKDKFYFFYSKGFNQCFVQYGFEAPSSLEEEKKTAMEVISNYFSSLGGPIFRLRSQPFLSPEGEELGGRAYQMGSYYHKNFYKGVFVFYAALRMEAKEEYRWALEVFWEEVQKLVRGEVDPKVIDVAREMTLAKKIQQQEAVTHTLLSDAVNHLYGREIDNLEKEMERVRHTTYERVLEVAREYFKEESLLKVVLFPEGKNS